MRVQEGSDGYCAVGKAEEGDAPWESQVREAFCDCGSQRAWPFIRDQLSLIRNVMRRTHNVVSCPNADKVQEETYDNYLSLPKKGLYSELREIIEELLTELFYYLSLNTLLSLLGRFFVF